MFRTHCTKNYNNDRRIWVYPYVSVAMEYDNTLVMLSMQENYKIMRIAMRHRATMVPYIYTEARAAHDTGMP